MSAQVASTCYETDLAAAHATAAQAIGTVLDLGGVAYIVTVPTVTATALTYRLEAIESSAFVERTVPFAPTPCGQIEWADALQMAWMIAAAWIATAAVLRLRKGVPGS